MKFSEKIPDFFFFLFFLFKIMKWREIHEFGGLIRITKWRGSRIVKSRNAGTPCRHVTAVMKFLLSSLEVKTTARPRDTWP